MKCPRLNRSAIFIIISITAFLMISECDSESEPLPPEPTYGSLKISVTYPEPVIVNGSLEGFQQVPGEGAVVNLYQNKDARCLGYKDAAQGFAMDEETVITPKYRMWSNLDGEIFAEDVEKVIAISRNFLNEIAAEGSDVGLCVASFDKVSQEIIDWGRNAKKIVLKKSDALELAKKHNIFLKGLTGTHDGIIGALAACVPLTNLVISW